MKTKDNCIFIKLQRIYIKDLLKHVSKFSKRVDYLYATTTIEQEYESFKAELNYKTLSAIDKHIKTMICAKLQKLYKSFNYLSVNDEIMLSDFTQGVRLYQQELDALYFNKELYKKEVELEF